MNRFAPWKQWLGLSLLLCARLRSRPAGGGGEGREGRPRATPTTRCTTSPRVPLEQDTADPKLPKVVLVAGHKSHGHLEHEFFAGCAVLMNLLKQNGVNVVMARDGWPKDEKIFDNAKCIVLYMDGGGGHPAIKPEHMALLQKHIDQGVGFVNLHYAVEYPADAAAKGPLHWLGGYYETGYSINPTWAGRLRHAARAPDHPRRQAVHDRRRVVLQHALGAGHEGRHADPQGHAARQHPRHPRRQEPPRPRGDRGLGLRPPRQQGRTTAAASASPAATSTATGATRTSAGSSSTPSSGAPTSTCPRAGAKVELDPGDIKKNLDDKRPKK